MHPRKRELLEAVAIWGRVSKLGGRMMRVFVPLLVLGLVLYYLYPDSNRALGFLCWVAGPAISGGILKFFGYMAACKMADVLQRHPDSTTEEINLAYEKCEIKEDDGYPQG